MGLDRDLKERIRHAFDYDYGGRLTAIANRALTIDAPILIIGLGGTGADAVIRIKKRIYDCFRRDQNDQVDDTEKPENIEYLVMDSDPGYATISCGGVGFTESLHECLIFRGDRLVSSLKNVETPDYIRNWINPELRHLLYNSNCSSACIRQVGRLSFFYNIAEVKDVLENKIKKVTSNYSNDVPLHVFILSGVCGATGGGIFIDVAYIVRALSEAIDNSRWVNRIGLLFMPDVNMGMHSINPARRENLKKNGFAALKELDYLMKIEGTGDCFEQSYGSCEVDRESGGCLPPFDRCMLISSRNKYGMDSGYDYAVDTAVETVIQSIVANSDSYEKRSHYLLLNHLDAYRYFDENWVDSVGVSHAVIPLNDIMSYMAYLAFADLDDQWNRIPTKHEIDDLADAFYLTERGIYQDLSTGAPQISGLNRHTFDLIKQAPQKIIADYNENLDAKVRFINQKFADMAESMEALICSENCPINDIFKDPDRGPMFAQRMIYTTGEYPSLEKVLKELKSIYLGKEPSAEKIDILQKASEKRMKELMEARPWFRKTKDGIRKKLVDSLDELYTTKFQQVLYKKAQLLCEKYWDLFNKKNSSIYSCISELLSTLIELFKKYAAISTQSTETKTDSGATLSWSMFDVPDLVLDLRNRLESDPQLHVDLHAFIKDFYGYLFNNADIWNGSRKADIVEELNLFISTAFNRVLSQSTDFYIDFIASSKRMTATAYSQKICSDLLRKSEIKFPVSGTYMPVFPYPEFLFVSVPNNAHAFMAEINQQIDNPSIIMRTDIKDRVMMMRIKEHMPLSSFADIGEYYKSYSELRRHARGLHLYEADKKNWNNLPDPVRIVIGQ